MSTGVALIPSGAFGAAGSLAEKEWFLHRNLLIDTSPAWLPEDWRFKYRHECRLVKGETIPEMDEHDGVSNISKPHPIGVDLPAP
jgi:hypothetical protein